MHDTGAGYVAEWDRPAARRTPRSRLDQALTVARRGTERRQVYDWSDAPAAAVVGIFEEQAPEPEPIAAAPPPPPEPAFAVEAAPPRPERLVTDLNPPGGFGGPARRHRGDDFGLGREWGSTWRWTAQGWVDQEAGAPTWRPVVTTTVDFPEWQVDTYLGMVAGEAAVDDVDDAPLLGRALDEGRGIAMQGMIDAAVARGAHAVVGANVAYTPISGRVVVTATGTAVALRDR